MQFCILSPISGLERYSTLSTRHLVLPQVQNETYKNFYRTRREKGDFVILDNGAWEGQKDWYGLLKAIEFYLPSMVVLPDYLLQPWEKTFHEAFVFLDRYHDQFNCEWGFCPQSVAGDVMGFLEGLIRAQEDSRVKWYCLPRALATHISSDPLMRVNVCRWLKRRGKRVHALGMLSGAIGELAFLGDAGCDSVDSNAPVWRGWNQTALGQPWKRRGDVNYEAPKYFEDGSPVDLQILDNLEVCGVNTTSLRKRISETGEEVPRR